MQFTVSTPGDQQVAIRAKGACTDIILKICQQTGLVTDRIPQDQIAIFAAGGKKPVVWTPGAVENMMMVALQNSKEFTIFRFPYSDSLISTHRKNAI